MANLYLLAMVRDSLWLSSSSFLVLRHRLIHQNRSTSLRNRKRIVTYQGKSRPRLERNDGT